MTKAELLTRCDALAAENAELREAAFAAKGLLWMMQDGQVLEYSKPLIGMVIRDLVAALPATPIEESE